MKLNKKGTHKDSKYVTRRNEVQIDAKRKMGF